MTSNNLTAALNLASQGIYVFPALASFNEETRKLDKKPAISEWRAKATTDVAQIEAWFTRGFPAAIPGIELGRSNLFVVDLDQHPGGADGIANFKAFRGENPAPQCPTVKTPGNGFHLYFRMPEGAPLTNRTGTLPAGVDCRGDGGWTVGPGAVFGPWQWQGDARKIAAAGPVPGWILEAVKARKNEYAAAPSLNDVGKRQRAYAEAALSKAANEVAASPQGRRNSELNSAAFCMATMVARGWIGGATVEGRLYDAATACGLPIGEARGTIKSGLEAGLKQPHADLPERPSTVRETAAKQDNPPASQHNWRDGLITAKALQTKTFAPVRIIVPSLIPEGVTILAGKPKIGKSWLALDICAAIAGDRFVLGETKPVQGDVLYLALEDNQRRLKKRLDKILQNAKAPESLEIHTDWRRVDQGGIDHIREWCEAHPKRRLIWIDTFVKIRPLAGKNEQAYAFDYRSIEGLQKLAGEHQVAIVINHHLRKAASEEDAFDDVSGTLGVTGAADTIIVMKRQTGMVKIFVQGRDIEEAEFAAEFNKETCRWRLVGEAEEVFRSEQRQAILTALKDAKRPMAVAEIMAAIERNDRHAIQVLLLKMEKDGEVRHVSRGVWALPTGSDPLNSVDFGDLVTSDDQVLDDTVETNADESQRKVNGSESVDFAGDFAEGANPLIRKGSAHESQQVNEVNGTCRSTNGRHHPVPKEEAEGLPSGQAMCWVSIREIRVPALGPLGDSLDRSRVLLVFPLSPSRSNSQTI
jgi:RecA-family ATPase